jgi:hypothetical protein
LARLFRVLFGTELAEVSAFAKCPILIPLHEDIRKDYGFFEAGAETLPIAIGTPYNNPIVLVCLLVWKTTYNR